jgi:hypothetical protein
VLRSGACRHSYDQLLAEAGPSGHHHEALIVVAIHGRRASRALRGFGRGDGAACGLLGREMRLLQGQLRNAELSSGPLLTAADLATIIRGTVDPATVPPERGDSVAPWPLGVDDGWASYRTDSGWHTTYWVAEWPRVEVGPDFLSPLLLGGPGRRTATVVMAPVAPAQAAREAEAARTADLADEELRRRAGFLATARRRRQAEGVVQREAELADGHGEFRFSGYVTVSETDRAALDVACAEVEQSARQAHLELRRLYGQQEQAFTWTLPLARGLAS